MYKLTNDQSVLRTNSDGTVSSIPMKEANTDYQEYLKWVAEGGVPLPPDSQE